jgi:hypothetical protein
MNAREELKRWIATVVQMSTEEESKVIKQDIDLFLAVAGDLSGKLADRNTALAKQIRPRSASAPKHSKPAPQKAQKEPDPSTSRDDAPKPKNDAEDGSQERSGQLSQRQRPEPSPVDQQQALRGYVYGDQNDEVQFQKAAKAITR